MPALKFFMDMQEKMDREAKKVWKAVNRTRMTQYQLSLGEVTVTEQLFYRLRKFWTKAIYIETNEPNEAATGADWDWLIGHDNNWLQIRVQAKIINKQGSFAGLGHPSSTGKQMQRLINPDPSTVTCRWMPLYVFYTADPPANYPSHLPHMCSCGTNHIPRVLGCSTQHALTVQDNYISGSSGVKKNRTLKASKHLPGSRPWSHIFDGLIQRLQQGENLDDIVASLAAFQMPPQERDIDKFWDSQVSGGRCTTPTSDYMKEIIDLTSPNNNTVETLIVDRPEPIGERDDSEERQTSELRYVTSDDNDSSDNELENERPTRRWTITSENAEEIIASLPRRISVIDTAQFVR